MARLDGDALVYLCDPVGPSCHTGAESCFFERLDDAKHADGALAGAGQALGDRECAGALRPREELHAPLLDGGPARVAAKVKEEGRSSRAIEHETGERVVSEAADSSITPSWG